jgi:hypothetical protein
MLKSIYTIDNFFDNPNEIIEFAKKQKFRGPLKEYQENWSGFRTKPIQMIDEKMSEKINQYFSDKLFEPMFKDSGCEYVYKFFTVTHFHYLTKDISFNESWFHKDQSLYAGVVYLNENPEEESGTILKCESGDVIIPNKFNRFVLYDSNITHSPQKGFGTDINDSRLTLTIFMPTIILERISTDKDFCWWPPEQT